MKNTFLLFIVVRYIETIIVKTISNANKIPIEVNKF